MSDPRVDRLAQTLVDYSIRVQPGDWVAVMAGTPALPLVRDVLRHIYRAGGHATVVLGDDSLMEVRLREGNDDQLAWVSPIEEMVMRDVDAFINIDATDNTRSLSGVDPRAQQRYRLARHHLAQIYMKRSAAGDLEWVRTRYPCAAFAQDADMSLAEYEDFVYAACFADQPDPIARWQAIHDEQARLIEWLAGKKEVTVRGPNADLRLSIEDRPFINADGSRNMPSGEIFTSPVEQSVNGWVRFTYPAVREGREVEGVSLRFKDGRIVEASAIKNEAYLLSQLDTDAGARYLGEFAIGTNYGIQRFTKSILYDEKIGGTIHLAVGKGFPESNSQNDSAVHWDFICDMRQDSEIRVDGELFYKNGQFQV